MTTLAGQGGTNIFTLLNFTGQIVKSLSQLKQSRIESDVFEFNAKIKQQEADLIRKKSILDTEIQREKNRRAIAKNKAIMCSSGIVCTAGSAADALLQTAEALEMDILINQFNADIDESRALNESRFQLVRAQSAISAGRAGAATTLLSALPSLSKLKFVKKTPKGSKPSGSTASGLQKQLEAENFSFFG